MDVKTLITVLFTFPMMIKEQLALNLQDYSNYIDRKKNEIKREQERARNFTNEFVREIEASCERRITNLTCNFDLSMCGFLQGDDDNFDWTRRKGSTSSSDTGPSFDHTTGNITGYYMFIETSPPRHGGDTAKLYSPPLKFLGNACLEFYYHMSGVAIGSLTVTINGKSVFYDSGNEGDEWNKAIIDVHSVVGSHKVIFEGVVGSRSSGDIAIDDFSLKKGPCVSEDCPPQAIAVLPYIDKHCNVDIGLILLKRGGIPSKITLASFKPHYSFNFSEAQRVCELLDGVLATERQMQAEWNKGFQLCHTGWLADGFAVTPMQQYHVGCYPAGLNRRYYEKQARLDAYCFDVN